MWLTINPNLVDFGSILYKLSRTYSTIFRGPFEIECMLHFQPSYYNLAECMIQMEWKFECPRALFTVLPFDLHTS